MNKKEKIILLDEELKQIKGGSYQSWLCGIRGYCTPHCGCGSDTGDMDDQDSPEPSGPGGGGTNYVC